jgi:hypothetical protein
MALPPASNSGRKFTWARTNSISLRLKLKGFKDVLIGISVSPDVAESADCKA